MKISVLKEVEKFETRVAITPKIVQSLKKLGFEVFIEKNAGIESGYLNEDYESYGAKITTRLDCLNNKDICLVVQLPPLDDLSKFSSNTILIGLLNPYKNKKIFYQIKDYNITSVVMELMPRISRAQSMDVLSSQANLAGYRSVIDAAAVFSKAFPMMMTAAGRIDPAKVMVLGAGAAGLQAIATAKRLGAIVSATDVRFTVKEKIDQEKRSEDDIAKGIVKFLVDVYDDKNETVMLATILTMIKKRKQS